MSSDSNSDVLKNLTTSSSRMKPGTLSTAEPTPKNKEPDVLPPEKAVSYLSIKSALRIRIRPPIRQYVNGQRYTTPGKSVEFTHGELKTRDPEVIECLNNMIDGENASRWRRIFWRRPSQKIIDRVSRVTQEVKALEQKRLTEELGEDDVKEYTNFSKFLKTQKEKLGKVTSNARSV
jgi:hypothetical protein